VHEATSVGPHCCGQLVEPQVFVAPPAAVISRASRFLKVSRLSVSLRFVIFISISFQMSGAPRE
jgi:hypothetical protein